MGYFKQLETDVQEMAHLMCDDYGFDPKTVSIIADCFSISREQVETMLSGDNEMASSMGFVDVSGMTYDEVKRMGQE
jgi:hypothetical protein